MKSETRLDSAVFQLTPTRTRCDLVISANGKTEKIASGLLNPFLAHLKSAQDQISKGGYSIKLEPDTYIDASWFTKGTVERFVRFVSTPEILERVTTIESEIVQIEDAISVQSSDTLHLPTNDDLLQKSTETAIEGTNGDSDKAIVIYKPGSQPSPNGNAPQEENSSSKVQLLKVLETRRNVLRKEQGMAFARAVAAGFDMDTLPLLLSFSESFGASRLLKASSQFMELWKRKHETGQWVEVEAMEAMSMRSEIPPFHIPPILLNTEGSENADGTRTEQKGPHEYYQGQFYPPWAMQYPPPPHHYPPYYQNYPYPPSESHHPHSHSKVSKHHSDTRSGTGTDHDSSDSESRKSHHKKGNHSKKKKKSQTVVIKNLNYITRKLNGSDSGSGSGSDSDKSESSTNSDAKSEKRKHKKSSKKKEKSGKNKSKQVDSDDDDDNSHRDPYRRDGAVYEDKQQEGDSGNWQAFQSFLMKAEEKTTSNDADMFSGERDAVPVRRREDRGNGNGNGIGTDPFLSERDYQTGQERSTSGFDSVNGRVSRARAISSNDAMLISGERGLSDMGLKEIEGGGTSTYRRTGGTSEEFMLYGQEKQMVGTGKGYLDPSIEGQYKQSNLDNNYNKSYGANDESFMIASRSNLNDNSGTERRNTIDIDSELHRKTNEISPVKPQVFYEPEELTMFPHRGFEPAKEIYDPIVDYESEMHIEKIVKVEEEVVEETPKSLKEEVKIVEKDKKVRKSHDSVLDKKRKDALVRRLSGTGTSRNPLAEAQKRAQNMRSYKADLQKLKKEQEEEQVKRLEALKLERQKRIAARTGPTSSTKSKPSPNSTQKPSKFTDTETNQTPIRKTGTKTATPPTKPNGSGNGLTRSVSSLSDNRKEQRNGSGHPKRLSEPTRSVTAARKSGGEKETKKISSAILQLDQSKSATLPEIKVSANSIASKSVLERVENEVVVEKMVVSVETEVVPVPVFVPVSVPVTVQKFEKVEKNEVRESQVEVEIKREEKREKVEVYEAVRAPPSPVIANELSSEVVIDHVKEEPIIPQNPTIEKPYQAPVARLTSLETAQHETEMPAGSESTKMQFVIDSPDRVRVDHTQELTIGGEKQKGKGGFRKLLKFGRKSHAESDASSVGDVANSSNDAHLLKNLISQEDTKVSKSFSLLSPFRKEKVVYL